MSSYFIQFNLYLTFIILKYLITNSVYFMKSFRCSILLLSIFLISFPMLNAQDEALKFVKSFIKNLDKQDFKSAYAKVVIPAWGDYKQFSSIKAFGSITSARLFEIKEENDIDSLIGIYVDAEYLDQKNGNARYKEKFYVSKKGEDLMIVKFKLIKKEKLPETKLHPSETEYTSFYKQVKIKLGLTDHKDFDDFIFINHNFTGQSKNECLIMHKIESGPEFGNKDMIGFLCNKNQQGKWVLTPIADRYTELAFYDFDKDSIVEIVEDQVFDYIGGTGFTYSIYSWKNNESKVLYENAQILTPVFQFSGGEELNKGDLISDETQYEIIDVNNDGFLELQEELSRMIITKDCTYPESKDEKVMDKFYNDYVLDEKRTIIYSYKDGKFLAE
jgi:hypothetical protein